MKRLSGRSEITRLDKRIWSTGLCMGASCSGPSVQSDSLNRLENKGERHENVLENAVLADHLYTVKSASDRRFGDFCLVKSLQSNNTSVVYSAKRIDWSSRVSQHTLDKSKVAFAVKVEHRNRLREIGLIRESVILNRLSHLHVIKMSHVQLFGTVPTRQYLYAYMPLFEQDLFTFIAKRGPLIKKPALMHTIMIQACSGVDALHRAGIVHADLKTENVLVKNASEETPFFVVADLGSAYDMRNEDYEETGHTQCTSSPEIVTNTVSVINTPADVFSIGCMLSDIAFLTPIFPPVRDQPHTAHLAKIQHFGKDVPFPLKVRSSKQFFDSSGYIYSYPPARIREQLAWWMRSKYKKEPNSTMMEFIRRCCCPDYRLRPQLEEVTSFTLERMLSAEKEEERKRLQTASETGEEPELSGYMAVQHSFDEVRRPRSIGAGLGTQPSWTRTRTRTKGGGGGGGKGAGGSSAGDMTKTRRRKKTL